MNKLLSTLDESVFTPELTSKIQELYESKINEINDSAKEELKVVTEAYEAKLQVMEVTLTEKAEAYGKNIVDSLTNTLSEEAEAKADLIREEFSKKAEAYGKYVSDSMTEKAEDYVQYVKTELTDNLNIYMDNIVEAFIEENKIAIDEASQTAKVNAILEGFNSLLVTSGVALSQIVEAKSEATTDVEVDDTLKESVNKLVKENAKLKNKIADLEKQEVAAKLVEGMSVVQRDKFETLSEMVAYTDMETYTSKLQTISEAIRKTNETNVEIPLIESAHTSTESYKRYF